MAATTRVRSGSWMCCTNDDALSVATSASQKQPQPPEIEREPTAQSAPTAGNFPSGDEGSMPGAPMLTRDAPSLSLDAWEPREFSMEEFLAALSAGVELIKHDRVGHARKRVLFTVDDGKHIFWRDPGSGIAAALAPDGTPTAGGETQTPVGGGEGGGRSIEMQRSSLLRGSVTAGGNLPGTTSIRRSSKDFGRSSKDFGPSILRVRPELPTSELLKVNLGTDPDPAAPELCGNAVLRASCPEEDLPRSFTLVYPDRTLDLTASCEEQKNFLVRGFRNLLQEQRGHRASTVWLGGVPES